MFCVNFLMLLCQVYLTIDFQYPLWDRANNSEVNLQGKQTQKKKCN